MSALRRTFDATFLNQVANHASVRPWLGSDRASPIDLSALIDDHDNVALVNEHGGFVFVRREPGVYEVHTQFLPSGRGAQANTAARQALRYMFRALFADKIVTDVPADNAAALSLALRNGFSRSGQRFDKGGKLSGKEQPVHELEMTRLAFFKASGRWGNDKLLAQEQRPCL